jgi:hypothetical protein
MKTLRYLFVYAVTILAGCAGPVWYQNGKTSQQAWQDYSDCQIQAAQTIDPHSYFVPGLIESGRIEGHEKDLIEACMRGKGYEIISATNAELQNYPQKK